MKKTTYERQKSTPWLIWHMLMKKPARSAGVLFCQFSAGVLEGIGIAAFIPLIGVLLEQEGQSTGLGRWVQDAFDTMHVAPTLGGILSVIVAIFVVKAILKFLATRQVGYASASVANELRGELIDSLMGVSWPYFAATASGGLANSITLEAENASDAYVTICQMLSALLQICVYSAAALIVSWQFTVLGLIAAVVTMTLLGGFIRISRSAGGEQVRLWNSIATRLVDGLQGMKLLKAMGREDRLRPMLHRDTDAMMEAQRTKVVSKLGLENTYEAFAVLMLAVVFYSARQFVGSGLEETTVMALLFYRSTTQVRILQTMYQKVARSERAYFSMREKITLAEQQRETFEGTIEPTLSMGIEFRNVSFSHGEAPVLKDVSIEIPRGKLINITGVSGSGKTTFLDLLAGLLRPTEGDVLVDGISLSDLDIMKWRHMLGYVEQDTLLFHDTIANNITLSSPELGEEDIERALRLAGALDFVQASENGLETLVGERGAKLSGGQRQRLAIARALIRNPEVLLLDEATSALDPDTEREICEIIASLKGRMTIIAISHRMALVEYSDVVYFIQGGRISERPEFSG